MNTRLNVILIIAVLFLLSVTTSAQITKEKLGMREQFAAEVISGDEEFLMDYLDTVPEDRLMEFFEEAIEEAIQVAHLTVDIDDDHEAYIFITEKINGETGVKQNIINKVEQYLFRDDHENEEIRTVRRNVNEIRYYFEDHFERFLSNIYKVRLQKSVF